MSLRRLCIAAAVLGAALSAPLLALPDVQQGPINAARAALLKGDGIAAEAALRNAIKAGASRPAVAAWMGEAMIDQGELLRARDWLEPVQFAPGDEGHGWRMLGLLERLEGNFSAAGQAYDKALSYTPRSSPLWVDIGRLRYLGGQQIMAIEAADRALAADPRNIRALEFRAQLRRDQSGGAAVLPLFEQALEIAPDDLALLGGYAATLGELGRAKDMLAVTRQMIEVSPKHLDAFYLQAVLAARAGRVDLARGLLARTGDRLKDVPAVVELQAILELETGNANIAAGLLEPLALRQGANQKLQLLLARALYEAGDYTKLHARYDALAARPDAPTYLLLLLARAYEEQGNRAAAAPLLDRASAASIPVLMPIPERDPVGVLALRWNDNPAVPETAVPYVRSLLAARDMAGAGAVATRFRQLHPGSSEAFALWGDVALASGQAGAALQAYEQSAQVRFPETLLLRMGEAFDQARRSDDAMMVTGRYLAAFPGSRLAVRMAASHRAYLGDWATARALLENLRLRGGNRDVRLLADLGLAQLRTDDLKAARRSAGRAYALQRSSGVATQALGMVLAASGEDDALARNLLDKARRIGGDNALLAQARAQLAGKGRS